MIQKFLIQKDRNMAKQAQDVLYIYDTIELFGACLLYTSDAADE